MKLLPDWKRILKRSWSLYAIGVASVLTGCEAVLASFGTEWIPLSAGWRMVIIFVVMMLAFWLRLVAQKNMGD